jgi:hypothetical protein
MNIFLKKYALKLAFSVFPFEFSFVVDVLVCNMFTLISE